MHDACRQFVAGLAAALPRPAAVLEVGSYDVNGSVRELFPGVPYLGLDLRAGPGVDIVADGADWQMAGGYRFPLVLCLETLEHTERQAELCRNLVANCAAGGVVLVTAAGPTRTPHGRDGGEVGEEFYRNVTAAELVAWLVGGCVTVLTEEVGDDVRAVAIRGAG